MFDGHERSDEQPLPALYPQANSPQAWSASAVFCFAQAGTLHVVRQPSPWSLTARTGERLADALTSLLPGK